jgi:hypothetical protein
MHWFRLTVEVAAVGVRDLRRHLSVADPVHVPGRHVQRVDHGVESGVEALDDRPELALVHRGVRARRQPPFDRCLRQPDRVIGQPADGVDAGVEVDLERVEVAAILLGDLRRDVTLRDPIDVLSRHGQWADHGVQRVVEPVDDLPIRALVTVDVGADVQLAVQRRDRQRPDVLAHCPPPREPPADRRRTRDRRHRHHLREPAADPTSSCRRPSTRFLRRQRRRAA